MPEFIDRVVQQIDGIGRVDNWPGTVFIFLDERCQNIEFVSVFRPFGRAPKPFNLPQRGVVIFVTWEIGERAAKSCGSSQGAPLNQLGVNWLKSATYQKADQSEIERCATAALKRSVWVIAQLVA